MTTLVLIHGRGQHGKDPDDLKLKWVAGLNRGLTLAGRDTLDPAPVVFPFYGDLLEIKKLEALTAGASFVLEAVRELGRQRIDPLMREDVAEVEADLLRSMAQQAGVDPYQEESWQEQILRIPGARKIAELLAERTNLDQEIIETHLTDVAVYLRYARDAVLEVIRTRLEDTDDRLVIVAHSLGSVVAHDLLDDPALCRRTTLLMTVGSPLGLEAVYRNLRAGGPVHPDLGNWVSVWDPDDWVALGHPLRPLYHEPLDDLRVDNPSDKAHAIDHYMGHEAVAARIADALAA